MGHGAEDSEDDGGAPTRLDTVVKPKKLKSTKPTRSNFEATSDEEED